jgi:hypothetical protein
MYHPREHHSILNYSREFIEVICQAIDLTDFWQVLLRNLKRAPLLTPNVTQSTELRIFRQHCQTILLDVNDPKMRRKFLELCALSMPTWACMPSLALIDPALDLCAINARLFDLLASEEPTVAF